MARFQYVAYDAAGRIERGEVDFCLAGRRAQPPRGARAAALSRPATLRRRISDAPASACAGPSAWASKVCADLTRELAVLLAADVPLDASLRLLVHKTQDRGLGALAERLLAGVNAGQPLSASLADPGLEAPPCWSICCGPARPAAASRRRLPILRPFLRAEWKRRGKVRSALVYPAVLCVTALGAIGIIITVLVPALLPLFADSGASPPLVLRLGHALGQGVGTYGYLWPPA